jgi:hypothetical protein
MKENTPSPEQIVKDWILRISVKHSDIGGHSICPFAKLPRIVSVKKLCLEEFANFDNRLTIYMEDSKFSSYEELEELCRTLKNINPTFVFLPDHPDKPNYINGHETGNGVFPCIIVQTKRELSSARSALEKTNYYSFWDQDYLTEIHSFD